MASVLKYIFVVTIILISVVPVIWVVFSSFKTNSEILSSAFGLPAQLRWDNYVAAFKVAPITTFYGNSILVAVMGTMLNLSILGMSGYVMARFQFKYKNLLTLLFSVALMLPTSALLFPLYITARQLHMYNTLWGLAVVYAGLGLPISLFIMRSYFLTIPKELEESAEIDGAGFLRTFLVIIVPIARPGFVTAAVLQFLLCWNEFQFALVLTSDTAKRTLPVAISYFSSQFSSNYGSMFAAITMIILPSIVIYYFLQEQVVSGLTAGAVKQ